MILGLVFKSLKSKPWRTVALIAAIALSVAMFFCMFSFEGAVYETFTRSKLPIPATATS